MISAVTARKAALAAQGPPIEESSPVSLTLISPSKPARTNPKRKSSSQKSQPEKKKLKKSKQPKSKTTSRNQSSADAFKDQEDVIIMNSGESSGEGMSMDDSDQGSVFQFNGQSLGERAWSPSQSAEDSPDDSMDVDADIEGAAQLDISSFFNKAHQKPQEDLDENRLLSTFEPSPDENMFFLTAEEKSTLNLSNGATLIALNAQDSLCLLGTCNLTILHGSITLCGITLLASSTKYPIYAPRSSPLPIIRASSKVASVLQPQILSPRLLKVLEFKAVIILQELRTNVENLGGICRSFEAVFEPRKWQKSPANKPFGIPGLYMVVRQTKEVHPFFLPHTWSTALESLSNSPADLSCGRYFVKGPQKCGKSTFARTLMNHLLGSYRRVAFLECDLGQSEFTPGGMVSLNIVGSRIFGPPFTHPTLPNVAHFIGATTPRSSPTHYLDAAMALIQSYRLDIQTPDVGQVDEHDSRISDVIPLVVNTMGWSKGLGADLTQRIEDMLEPTDIFDINPSKEQYPIANDNQRSRYAAFSNTSMADESLARLHELQPVISSSSVAGYTPADHRAMSILSYFHARFPLDITPGQLDQITAHSWDTSKPLCAIPPYELDCTIAIDKVILAGAGSEDVVEEEIGRVLNGAIVGMVRCEPGTIDLEGSMGSILSTGVNYTRYLDPPSPSTSRCVGIALIRGISPPMCNNPPVHAKTYLHMLTPLPHSLLACARVLVKGEMELPIWGMLDFRNFDGGKGVNFGDVAGVERDKVPFLQWGKAPEGAMGADKRRVRRNLMRRGQM